MQKRKHRLRRLARQRLAESRLYRRATELWQGAEDSAPTNAKLRKLRQAPEAFFRDAEQPLVRRAGLYLVRRTSLADLMPNEGTDLPARSLLVFPTRHEELASLSTLSESFSSNTELVIALPQAAFEGLAPALIGLSNQVRVYLLPEASPDELVTYALARCYADQVVLLAGEALQAPQEIDLYFRQLRLSRLQHADRSWLALRRSESQSLSSKAKLERFAKTLVTIAGQESEKLFCLPPAFEIQPALSLRHPFEIDGDTDDKVYCIARKNSAMELPTISVVLTCFNAATTIRAAMLSILQQCDVQLELIVVDDRSSDESPALIQSLANQDARIRILRTDRNRGTYWAKNMGLAVARGDLVTFQDADDISLPQRLRQQAQTLALNPEMLANYVRHQRLDEHGNEVWLDGESNRPALITLMMRREEILATIGYFDSVRIAADEEYVLRLQAATGTSPQLLPVVSYYARHAEGSLTTAGPGAFREDQRGRRILPRVRADYRKAFQAWHQAIVSGAMSPIIGFPPLARPFPAPPTIDPERDV